MLLRDRKPALHPILTKLGQWERPLGRDTVMEVAAKWLFPQKLGPNPSEMEVRTFLSVTKVIWNQVRFLRLKLSRRKLC